MSYLLVVVLALLCLVRGWWLETKGVTLATMSPADAFLMAMALLAMAL